MEEGGQVYFLAVLPLGKEAHSCPPETIMMQWIKKTSCLFLESNSDSQGVQLLGSHYTHKSMLADGNFNKKISKMFNVVIILKCAASLIATNYDTWINIDR